MKNSVRQTRSYLMAMFKHHGFNPRTDLGQNFLIDLNILEFVVERGRIDQQDVVLEVGAGTGGMTTFLSEQAAEIVSVELDTNMHRLAGFAVAMCDNVTLLQADALKNKNNLNPDVMAEVDRALAVDPDRRLKLIANLPYSVATPVVSNLVATEYDWAAMVVMIQLELAERMTAKPGSSDYGSLSVWLQAQCDVKLLKKVPPTVFWPRPKVTSSVVRLLPNIEKKKEINDRPFFQDFLRRLFHQRRKLLRSVLVGMYRKQLEKPEVDAILSQAELPENARAETLDVKTLVDLGNRFQTEITERTAEKK